MKLSLQFFVVSTIALVVGFFSIVNLIGINFELLGASCIVMMLSFAIGVALEMHGK